jgi:hypothetical protein
VQVTLAVDRPLFSSGDTAKVAVTALNRGGQTVTINGGGCPSAFTVIDERDSVGMPGPQICFAVLYRRQLHPGESYVFRYAWRLDRPDRSPLQPGTYRLKGHVFGDHLRAESAPVEIRIVGGKRGQ